MTDKNMDVIVDDGSGTKMVLKIPKKELYLAFEMLNDLLLDNNINSKFIKYEKNREIPDNG